MQTERGETPAPGPDDDREGSTARGEGNDEERRARDNERAEDAQARREQLDREEVERREQQDRQEREREAERAGGPVRRPPQTDQEREEAIRRGAARDATERDPAFGDARTVAEIERTLPGQKSPVRQAISLLEPMYRSYGEGFDRELERLDITRREDITPEIYRLADLAGKNAIREYVEDLLRAQEEDDVDVRPEDQQQLRSAINTVIADDELRAELATRAQARALAHMGGWTSKYIGTEQLSQVVTGFLPHHLKELAETEGVSDAIDILEEQDKYGIKGEYYRGFESETAIDTTGNRLHRAIWNDTRPKTPGDKKKALKDVEIKFKIVEEARKSQKTKRRAPHESTIYDDLQAFEGHDNLIEITLFKLDQENPNLSRRNNPKQAIDEIIRDEPDLARSAGLIDESGNRNEARIKEYDSLIYKIDRAFQIAQRLHHTFGMSALWDGPRWEKGTIIPDKYGGGTAGENQLVQLHIKVPVQMPKDHPQFPNETIEVDLNTAADEQDKKNRGEPADERVIAAWLYFRSKRKRIAEITTKAWRDFYADENNWKNIAFERSAANSGRGAKELSRVMNYPVILMHASEAHPGRKSLRKYAYLNVPSLMEMDAYTGAKQIINNWGDDYYYMKIGWVNSRLRNVEKFKSLLTTQKPRLINSNNSIKDFINTLDEVKEAMRDYLTDEEYGEVMENWVRGFLDFRRHHSEEADLMNLERDELERRIDHAQERALINTAKNDAIRRDMFAPRWLKALERYRPFSQKHFPGNLIWKTYESVESVWQFLKGLSWGHGIFDAIKEFFKQLFVIPK